MWIEHPQKLLLKDCNDDNYYHVNNCQLQQNVIEYCYCIIDSTLRPVVNNDIGSWFNTDVYISLYEVVNLLIYIFARACLRLLIALIKGYVTRCDII